MRTIAAADLSPDYTRLARRFAYGRRYPAASQSDICPGKALPALRP